MATQLLMSIELCLRELCAERGVPVDAVRFFGSYVAGTANDDSDVDPGPRFSGI